MQKLRVCLKMVRLMKLTVTEILQYLKKRRDSQNKASSKEGLQVLFWVKKGYHNSPQKLVEIFNYDEAKITSKCLNTYKQRYLKTPPIRESWALIKSSNSKKLILKRSDRSRRTQGLANFDTVTGGIYKHYCISTRALKYRENFKICQHNNVM